MAEVILITGGQRSGKSSYAQKIATELGPLPIYLATSKVWDDDFKARIERHKADRADKWQTIEEHIYIHKINFIPGSTVVLDCITLWLTNIFTSNKFDVELSLAQAKKIWERLEKKDITLITISNEIGMSLHATTEAGRKFTDLQGWINQYIAERAETVYLMVSGIPLKIK